MGGSSIQLFAQGPQDFHLTANPQITFFKSVFRRHTNFASEIVRLHFYGDDPKIGTKGSILKIKREGDLIGDIYFEVDITGTSDSAGVYTINHFGNSFIKKIEVLIGGYIIDTQYSQWFQIFDELTNTNNNNNYETSSSTNGGKSSDLNFLNDINHYKVNMNDRINGNMPLVFGGNKNNISTNAGTYNKKIIIPLKFWFNKNPGMYLPLISLYNHEVELKIDFEDKYKLIGNSTNITSLSANIKAFGKFITLDGDEKKRFSQSNHEYIIEQTQLNNNSASITTTEVDNSISTQLSEINYELNFSHPVKYMAFVINNEGSASESLSNNSGMGPCYFVSLCSNSIYGNDGNDGTVKLSFDGEEREKTLPMTYYTRVFPKIFCKNTIDLDRIGLYSFALNPFDIEPSGTCNFSKILNKNLQIKFANNNINNISAKNLYIFAVNYNILVITNGMAGLRYS